MQNKKFSVFISSTYDDLREERQAVQDAVLSAGDFPVQMENWPAADEDQFEFIKALINQCDYYVLIVAGRYGSLGKDGISYTEKEYQYAVSRQIPVLVMLHGDRGSIATEKTEASDVGKKNLERFISEISTGRVLKKWASSDALKHAVRDALDHAKATAPGTGWLRGDTTASADLLQEMNELRKENEKFRETIGTLEIELALPPIPAADDLIEIDLLPVISGQGARTISSTYAKIKCTWLSAFPVFCEALDWGSSDWGSEYSFHINEHASRNAIGESFASERAIFDTVGLYTISKNTFSRLLSYYVEIGLMTEEGERPFTEVGRRAARRQQIACSGDSSFSISEGKIDVEAIDDIPF